MAYKKEKERDSLSIASAPDIILSQYDYEKNGNLEMMTSSLIVVPDERDMEHSLLGLAPRYWSHRCLSHQASLESVIGGIHMTEIAPVNSNIYDPDIERSWQMPIDIFSSKKGPNSPAGTQFSRRIRSYYKAQDELITAYENLQHGPDNNSQEMQDTEHMALILSRISFFANLLLLVGKSIAVSMSSSISIISSLVDSSVDLLSGIIIWWTSSAMKKRNIYLYPSGRTRLEPVAIVILSVIMSLASFQLLVESIQKIVGLVNNSGDIPTFNLTTIIITSTTVVLKFGLFVLCYCKGRNNPSVKVLMQDHRNDTLSNLIAIICGYLGSREFVIKSSTEDVKYIDPCGAIIISGYILFSWWRTGWDQIKMLTGHTAKPGFLSKITWICLNHHKSVLLIDTVRAFHFGNNFLVEVDIVLPEEMSLREAHNIGETLQQKLEKLSDVERAFVHLDYETTHRPEEEHKLL
ncbi:hypothetical protein SNE40_014547 [Patella caerulea]|uniref:Cation efflux protein cytoplasmic domain-containing protein n=1 Tax=Patella caerulea TaxID=87958 RepID=A0AAN8JI86_PATCE